jgi:gamma-glutamyl hercynylcysteine S-oxide synthase
VISELNKSSIKDLTRDCAMAITTPSGSIEKSAILKAFQECRAQTLALFEQIDSELFYSQIHPDFSPIGWHLGHIAFTESLWLLERSAGEESVFPQYRQLYAADGLPKSQRVQLPSIEETRYYLDTVREKVVDYLEFADIPASEKLWLFLLQHECQHCETISFILELIKITTPTPHTSEVCWREHLPTPPILQEMIKIPAGEFIIGSNEIDALDNEMSAHQVYLDTYFIDSYPVICKDFRYFMQAEGYEKHQYWSDAGWKWLQSETVKHKIKQPLYWHDDATWDNHPVCGVSYYEAEAYAKFVGKRLPTEAEWEKAARWDVQSNRSCKYPWGEEEPTAEYCNCAGIMYQPQTTPVNTYPQGKSAFGMYDALGNVWEWTSSWFDGYPGFKSYPYTGYSQLYFDGEHRVLKGGSWSTRIWVMRSSFRNWYHPHVREIFAGFRCVRD